MSQWILETEEFKHGSWRSCGDGIEVDVLDVVEAVDLALVPEDFGPGRYRIHAHVLGSIGSDIWSAEEFIPAGTVLFQLQCRSNVGPHFGRAGQPAAWFVSTYDDLDDWDEVLDVGVVDDVAAAAVNTLPAASRALGLWLWDRGLAVDPASVSLVSRRKASDLVDMPEDRRDRQGDVWFRAVSYRVEVTSR